MEGKREGCKGSEGMYGFIVEGEHDKHRVQGVIRNAMFVVTEGTRYPKRVPDEILGMILACKRVYILTDPDKAGEQIAERVQEEFPNIPRINLDIAQCKGRRGHRVKIGVSHAEETYLLKEIMRVIGR